MAPTSAWTLVLATSGPHAEVGLASGDGRLLAAPLGEGAARGREVLPRIASLVASAGLCPADLEAVAVDAGPGSFTGVRVGVTVAKTLAWALDLSALAVSSLAALARAAPPEREVVALRDAGRGRVYFARFGPEAEGLRPVREGPGRRPLADLAPRLAGALLVGEEVEALLGGAHPALERRSVRAGAAAVWAEARPRLAAGERVPAHVLAPVYLQASAPERRRAGESDETG